MAWDLGLFTAAMNVWWLVAQHTCANALICDPHDNEGWRYAYTIFGLLTRAMYIGSRFLPMRELLKYATAKSDYAGTSSILDHMAKLSGTQVVINFAEEHQVFDFISANDG